MAIALAAPNLFGIGEFWSGFIIGIFTLPTLGAMLWFGLDLFEDSDLGEDQYPPDRPAAAGVLVCDYVDDSLLHTIAQQTKIDPAPRESERGREVNTESSVGLQRLPLIGRFLRRSSESERARFEHREDHNVLLSSVLEALEKAGDLRRELTQAPGVSLSPHVLDELAAISEQHDEADAARQALTAVQAKLVASEKRSEFESAVATNAFVLAEGPWSIRAEADRYVLSLKRLGPRRPMYGPDTEATDMPAGVALEVNVPRGQLSTQGNDRLDAAEQTAAVFGIAGKAQDGTLTLTPVAVFGRFGVPGDGEVPRGPGVGYPYNC